MDIKYQIFISSTYEDLRDERRVVTEQILNMGHIPVGMELFQAGNDDQWSYIRRRILECDYYIVIIAERYGSISNSGKSYTEMEYDYAVDNGMPVAAFLLSADAQKAWPNEKVEYEQKQQIKDFRDKCQNKMVRYWSNSYELASQITLAVHEMIKLSPRTGWVRPNSLASIDALNEIARLSTEKRDLQSRLQSLESSGTAHFIKEVETEYIALSSMSINDYFRDLKDSAIESILDVFLKINSNCAIGIEFTELVILIIKYCKASNEDQRSAAEIIKILSKRGLISVSISDGPRYNIATIRRIFYITQLGTKLTAYCEALQGT